MPTGSRRLGLWWRATVAALGLFGISGNLPVEARADADPPFAAPGVDSAKQAATPITPKLAGEVVATLQGGDYAGAIKALDALLTDPKTTPTDRSFYCLVRGGADRLAGRPDDARSIWTAALGVEPKGVWANKIRSELAALELATGHADRAEVMVRAEAEALLNPDRKDRLALVYRDFARRLLEPEFPGAKPDPVAAYALLAKGRDLAKGEKLRAELLFAMGRAGQQALPQKQANNAPQRQAPNPPTPPNPVGDYQTYLKEYPQGADRDEVRFHLGETQLANGSNVDARTTWTDLARDLERCQPGIASRIKESRQPARGQALYGIARTMACPTVAEQAETSTSASRRSGASSERNSRRPQGPTRRVRDWSGLPQRQGQADPAIAAFRSFLKGEGYPGREGRARRGLARTWSMRATFLIARATQQQGKFPEAIAAFEAYLNRFPNGVGVGRCAAGRSSMREFASAGAASEREQYADARAGWLKFAETNPLDNRVPEALFLVGQSSGSRSGSGTRRSPPGTPWPRGSRTTTFRRAWRSSRPPRSFETEKGDPAAAIERFRKVAANDRLGGCGEAADRHDGVEGPDGRHPPDVPLGRDRAPQDQRRGTSETLTFSAYKLNPEAYFRKKHTLSGVELARYRPGRPRRRMDRAGAELREVQAGRGDL